MKRRTIRCSKHFEYDLKAREHQQNWIFGIVVKTKFICRRISTADMSMFPWYTGAANTSHKYHDCCKQRQDGPLALGWWRGPTGRGRKKQTNASWLQPSSKSSGQNSSAEKRFRRTDERKKTWGMGRPRSPCCFGRSNLLICCDLPQKRKLCCIRPLNAHMQSYVASRLKLILQTWG